MDLDFVVLGMNAHTIGHGRGRSKGPTRSTPSLVPNHGDGLTVGPFLPGVEFFRDLLVPQQGLFHGRHEFLVIRVNAEEAFDVVGGGLGMEVVAGLPCLGFGIDVLNVLLGDDVILQKGRRSCCRNKGQNKGQFFHDLIFSQDVF